MPASYKDWAYIHTYVCLNAQFNPRTHNPHRVMYVPARNFRNSIPKDVRYVCKSKHSTSLASFVYAFWTFLNLLQLLMK